MNTIAIILMVSVQLLVTAITGYFFYKVMTVPADKHEPLEPIDPFADEENS